MIFQKIMGIALATVILNTAQRSEESQRQNGVDFRHWDSSLAIRIAAQNDKDRGVALPICMSSPKKARIFRMTRYICTVCGSEHAESTQPPTQCAICNDERQYVNWEGQTWTTLPAIQEKHRNEFRPQGQGITGVGITPSFAIGERALLVQTAQGNLLWDCIALIDDATVQAIQGMGGLAAIAISHPHYYTSMVSWSERFGNIPIYLHADDRQHVQCPSPNIVFWEGETKALFGGLTLIRCGGHYEGGTAMHWAAGEDGAGSLFTGDVIQVVQDRRWVSFMRSFPNYIPLPPAKVQHIVDAVEPFAFERIYGAWWNAIVDRDGKGAVRRSAERYIRAVLGQ